MRTVQFLAPNQCYFYTENDIYFQSYNTIVCKVENYESFDPVINITPGQPQSNTTAKYLNKFLSEITGGEITNYKNI